jgi:glycerol-3-phosphate responsive antiterminator
LKKNLFKKKKKREFFLIFSLFLIEKSEMEEIKQAVW